MTNTSNNFHTYPPFFLQNNGVDYNHNPTKKDSAFEPETESAYCSVPVIDFELINKQNLSEICKEWGMFRLVNHGVPMKLLSQILEHANKIFNLSFETKQALLTNPISYFWGSAALTMAGNACQTRPSLHNVNWLEGLNVPLCSEFQYQDPLLESFRSLIEEYGSHQARLAKTIFKTMAEDLNFFPTKSKSYLSLSNGGFRVYRYFRCPMEEERLGLHEHTDSSVITILHQDEVGGLQVYKDGKWLDVKPIADSLIVNLGDMMQAMSNDKYISAKHRVKVNTEKERVSIGYFVFPEDDAVVESSRYKPFTYADFRATKELDLKNLGMKIGLPRFRLTEN